MHRQNLFILITLVGICFAPLGTLAKEVQGKDAAGRDYWVYLPDKIDPEKTYTLVVGVHGYRGNGKGAGGYAGWAKRHDVIVLGPTYDSDGYQYLQRGSDLQTIELVRTLRKQYKLHDKLFIAGFSGGSQYAHRFAMKYPELVAGCAAHSGGTWATGDYAVRAKPNPEARGVLFVMSCGENDTKKSFGEAPFGRLEWAKRYEKMLEQGGFIYDAQYWPGVGHNQSQGARQQSLDCFIASTKRLPEYEAERAEITKAIRGKDYADAWTIIQARLNHEDKDNPGILGKVHGLYVGSLENEITRIDRMAEREVRKIVRDNDDPAKQRVALEAYKHQYAGAPKTTRAVDNALEAIDGSQ